MAISSTTARADIFKEWLALIKTNLTTSGVKITNAYVDDISSMPQIVINSPSLPRNREAFGTSSLAYNRDGEIEIEVFARSMKELVELVDDVENTIFSNMGSLGVTDIALGDSTDGSFDKSGKTVRVMLLPFSFKFKK